MPAPYKTITLEEHFITRDYIRVTGGYAEGPMAAIAPKLLDLGQGRIAAMDEAGISLQVLSAAAMGFDDLDGPTGTALATSMNDELAAAVKANSDRFRGFASLGLKEPEQAARELERCVGQLGFVGAMINGTTGGAFLDDPKFTPVLEAAVQLRVPIYLHPAPPPKSVMKAYFSGMPDGLGEMLSIAGWGWHAETGLHTLRVICAGVFDRLPGLQMIIGHMGEGLPYAMARSSGILSGPAKLKQTVADYFKSNITVTTSGYFSLPPLQCALDVLGIERLVFSVAYPFSLNTRGAEFLGKVAEMLSEADMAKLTHANAERVLAL